MTDTPRTAIPAVLLALAALARADELPKTFPRFDLRRADSAIVVARVAPGAILPELEECKRPDTVCLRSPFWFRAQVLATVSGHVAGPALVASTLSHYGMASFVREPAPRLLSLKLFQGQVVMPVNAWAQLVERRDGELFLVDYDDSWPSWLPCAAPQLREPLDEQAFAPTLKIGPDDAAHDDVDEHRDLYRITPDGAFPRYGIAVSRLRAQMTTLAAQGAPTTCPRPD